MKTLKEKREALLEQKLRDMADIGVEACRAEERPFYDQPIMRLEPVIEAVSPSPPSAAETQKSRRCPEAGETELLFCEYEARFLVPRTFHSKSGFTINADTLQMLRDVLQSVKAKTTLTAYIENILVEHLKTYQDLLNETAARRRPNKTLDL